MDPSEQQNIELYNRFLDAMNAQKYDILPDVIADGFVDHHPGFSVSSLSDYRRALETAHATLALHARLDSILAVDDKAVTRVSLTGRHIGPAFNIPPTGRDVQWSTTEIWRIEDGRFVERWAQDDLLGLVSQLSSDEEAENVQLIRHLNDVVNDRNYDGMDDLFSPSFKDNNPAWSVSSLAELKDIIRKAHEALDMSATQDQIYAAQGSRVVEHLTFHGRHVGEFLGRTPTGKSVIWTSIEIYRLDKGRIEERWVQADTSGLMRQLGVELPA